MTSNALYRDVGKLFENDDTKTSQNSVKTNFIIRLIDGCHQHMSRHTFPWRAIISGPARLSVHGLKSFPVKANWLCGIYSTARERKGDPIENCHDDRIITPITVTDKYWLFIDFCQRAFICSITATHIIRTSDIIYSTQLGCRKLQYAIRGIRRRGELIAHYLSHNQIGHVRTDGVNGCATDVAI